MKRPERASPERGRRLVTASAWGREDSVTASGDRVSFGADGNILELVVIIARLGEYTKNRGTVHFKRVTFMVCELHFDKKRK